MMPEHDRLREWAAAYVLGVLDPAERLRFSAHLRDCARCRDEVAALAPLPPLLATVSDEEVTGLSGAGGVRTQGIGAGEVLTGAEAADGDGDGDGVAGEAAAGASMAAERAVLSAVRQQRLVARRLRRWQMATTIAAGVLVAAVISFAALAATGTIGLRDGPVGGAQDDVVAMTVERSQASAAAVDLARRGWGTEIALRLEGLPPRNVYVLSVTGADGARQQIGTWGRTPSSAARISAATAIPVDDLRSVEVTSEDVDDVILLSRP